MDKDRYTVIIDGVRSPSRCLPGAGFSASRPRRWPRSGTTWTRSPFSNGSLLAGCVERHRLAEGGRRERYVPEPVRLYPVEEIAKTFSA